MHKDAKSKSPAKITGGISACPFRLFIPGPGSLEPGATRSGRSVTSRTGPAAKTITFREERGKDREKTENGRGLPTSPAWVIKMPGFIAEYGRKHLSAPGNKTPHRIACADMC